MRTETTEIFAGITPSEEVVLTAVTNLNSGRINEAIANFAEEFRFKDHGMQLEFNTKESLTEFFRKARELLLGYAAADRHHVCERRPSPYRMDA